MRNLKTILLRILKSGAIGRKWLRAYLWDKSIKNFRNQATGRFLKYDIRMISHESTETTDFDRHYIYHTAWASQIIAQTRPSKHIDISSAIYFSTIASAFVPIEFYDFRPPLLELDNLIIGSADLTNLHFEDDSIASLSCMHVVEHVGLGRYGDPIDYNGDIKSASELQRVLARGGSLLFVVPVGHPAKVVFNAQRIYSYRMVIEMFPYLELSEFSLIPASPTNGHLIRGADPLLVEKEVYGCGCFWFRKPN